MSVSVEGKINSYVSKNPDLAKMPKEQVASIMQQKGLLSKFEVENWYAELEKKVHKTENHQVLTGGGHLLML